MFEMALGTCVMHQEEDLPSPVDLPLHWMSSFGLTVHVMPTPSCVSEVHQSERMPTACLPHPMTWIGPGLGQSCRVFPAIP